MKVHRHIADLAHITGPIVLAIGVFDGLHLGHKTVLERAREEAARIGGTAIPLSFDPHPAKVLRPDQAPLLLTATEHKLRLLASMGFDEALLLPFDQAFATLSAEDFITRLSKAARPLAAICVGYQWSFGKGRQGNLQTLARLGAVLHFSEIGIPEIDIDGEAVSSTRIRNAVAEGSLSIAQRLLGRPYTVLGRVEHGRAIGRTIGFPTANLALFNEQLPPTGVYAVLVTRNGSSAPLMGVANLGVRPTVADSTNPPSLEVHLFDFSDDLYSEILEVEFVAYLRPEKKFASLEDLKDQIARDATAAKAVLRERNTDAVKAPQGT